MTTEAEKVFQQIEALPPHEQLVLAAGLLENRKPELAYKVLSKVKEELGAWLAIQHKKDRDAESLKLRKIKACPCQEFAWLDCPPDPPRHHSACQQQRLDR